MNEFKTQIGDVRYNAVDQCFEALVTFYTPSGRVRVAAQFQAPLSTEFSTASQGLWNAALAQLDAPGSLQSRQTVERVVPPRKPRPRLNFSLQSVTTFFGKLAA